MMKGINKSGLFIGTSGWSYKHWSGNFYPEEVKPANYLEYYITQFNCVELNSSFYHLPRPATVEGWMRRTPDDFIFCPKISRFITHRKKLRETSEPVEKFFNVMKGLKLKTGPVLVQFPPGLHYDKNLIVDFLNVLKGYNDYRFAIEARHKSWFNDEYFDLLAKNEAASVIADSGKRFPSYEAVTAGFIYIRFHGREKLYASEYSEDDLKSYAGKIRNWLNEGKETWIFFNNDFGGFATKNALRLNELILISK